MYVEDLFVNIQKDMHGLFRKKRPFADSLTEWQIQFVYDVGCRLDNDDSGMINLGRDLKVLSTKQAKYILDIIQILKSEIVERNLATNEEIVLMLSQPKFRKEPYESTNVPKEVRYIGDNFLAFRFKPNPTLKDQIKILGDVRPNDWIQSSNKMIPTIIKSRFDWYYKIWIVPVTRQNIIDIETLIRSERFNMDDVTRNYIRLAYDSRNKPSDFTIDTENDAILINVKDNPILAGWVTEVAGGMVL